MKKQLLPVILAFAVIGSAGSVSANDATVAISNQGAIGTSPSSIISVYQGTTTEGLQQKWEDIMEIKRLHEQNQSLHQDSKEALQIFHTENKESVRDMRKKGTEIDRESIKQAHDDRVEYIQSLSGMTLEMRAQYMSGIEDRIRHEIDTRFAKGADSLHLKRMAVYTDNAARRAEVLVNRLQIRSYRGNLRITEIDSLIAKITTEIPSLSTAKKTAIAKKIDERILQVEKNKKLPDVSKTVILKKLTELRNSLLK